MINYHKWPITLKQKKKRLVATPFIFWFPSQAVLSLDKFVDTYYHVKESKLDLRAKKALFMGISSGVKGYHLWCPISKKIIFNRDVTFDKSTMLKKVTHIAILNIRRRPVVFSSKQKVFQNRWSL